VTDSSHGSFGSQDGDDVTPQGTPDVGLEDIATGDVDTQEVNTEVVNDTPEEGAAPAPSPAGEPEGGTPAGAAGAEGVAAEAAGGVHPDTVVAAERLADLQRLQAEYVNYKKRVDRDRAMVQELAVHSVIEALLPVLDDIHAARQHGDLESGPFAAIADKLESTLGKFGLERYGGAGEVFDPSLHEALMHAPWPQDGSLPERADSTTVVQVLQPGYRAGERVIRPARVAVADPE
jgi:molecular chaperone GrpE